MPIEIVEHSNEQGLRIALGITVQRAENALTGEDESAAVEALNSLIDKEYKSAKLICDQENVEYDKLTAHGTAICLTAWVS